MAEMMEEDSKGSPESEQQRRRRRDEEDDSDRKKRRDEDRERTTRTLTVDKDDAAFVLGRGGTTKRKIARVSGSEIELDENALSITITGTRKQCDYAEDYINFIRQQRVGPVTIDVSTERRDDFTAYSVPADCIGFVMGRNGQTLRSMEEEWGVLMFFAKTSRSRAGDSEQLCIFGPLSARRGAELKTMSAVEHKHPGYCVSEEGELREVERVEGDEDAEDWGVDTVPLSEENFSYALGAQGSTRRKLAAASGCIIEYVGRLACFSGMKKDRRRGKDYLRWLLEQRTGQSAVEAPEDREDCAMVKVPSSSVAFLTGYRGESLRGIERESNTFCFTDGDRSSGGSAREYENLLIFSYSRAAREHAREIVEDRLAEHKRIGPAGARRSYAPPSEACWDYQRGRCQRGDSCRFSHNWLLCYTTNFPSLPAREVVVCFLETIVPTSTIQQPCLASRTDDEPRPAPPTTLHP
ncbi:hypothetical protein CTAYLR_010213 [Chrysophaeum taylorii]|uniref:C3H1-type domain-containing protein n=1 Tax=Chrysophaeum taylorii TaxID=2483200 RepID=A0AAD7U8D3_9STRA|nr:hypothetical protein CTAYLR_010213 [Chrysophaeum taylorii]